MLKKKYRISQKQDFDRVYNTGKKVKGEFGMLIGLEEKALDNCEFGMVVGKKKGKANERNKFKRWFRNIVQELLSKDFFKDEKLKVTYIAFKKPDTFKDFEKELLEQFKILLKK
jgi:ribonuclease P protein component